VLVVVALVYAILERLRRSPFGRVLRAIREDEIVAAVAGKPVFRFKVQAFALGAGIAGLAGILFAHYLAYVEPNMFLPQESLFVWLALILGGSGNNRGALLGSLVLLGLLEGSRFAKDVIPFLTGVRLAAAQQILVGVVLEAVFLLVVHDLRREAAAPLLERRAVWADSPRDVAAQCDVICTCVPGPPEMQAVTLGARGILEGVKRGSVVIDHTTNAPA